MALVSAFRSILPTIGKTIFKAVAPGAVDALKTIAGKGIDSLFQAGSKGLQGILSKVPFAGPLLSGLVEKYAPKLADVAKNFLGGKLDQLLAKIVGQPTERPVPGAPPGTTVVTPPVTTRAGEIAQNTPSTGSQASTGGGSVGGSSASSGSSPAGGFPPYPKQPSDPKDLAQQNKYQEEMFNYQQAMQMMMQHWNMMTTTSKAAFEGTNKIIGNLPVR